MRAMANAQTSWRSTYLLGVALLLPIGTLVLACYYFARMNPFSPEPSHSPWAFSIIALAGGLSAFMAVVMTLFASATYRARVRYEAEYRNLQRYLNEDVAKERTRLTRNLDLVSAAQQVSMAIKQEVEFERILSVVLEQLEHFARSDSISVFTIDEDNQAIARAERRAGVDRFPPVLTEESIDRSLVDDAVRIGRQLHSLDPRTGEFVLAVYFATPDGARGVVRIARNVADEPDFIEEVPAYEQAVGQLVRMVSLGLKTASIWNRAIKDEKTGLFNNNHYQDQMKKQVAHAQRTGSPLSLIMMDIDKFKHVNDTYGHLAGDIVLERVASILKREARESDTVFRYGGEELCIVCKGTTEADAAYAAERLRHIIACTEFTDDRGQLLPISASFGVAEFEPNTMHGDLPLKELCDRALYVAKEHGRNRVVVARSGGEFQILERSGDMNSEVKFRMGLAGDNAPLSEDGAPVKRRARDQLGASLGALASGLSEVAGADSDRVRVVDSVVREATEYLTRNLSQRLSEEEEPEKPKRRRKTQRRKEEEGQTKPAPKRRKNQRRKAAKPAEDPEEAKAKAESDRLDYLTDEEAEQLVAGQAPSKRLRKASRASKG
jgi:diguanylate cyclase (GGDEF)-like protein